MIFISYRKKDTQAVVDHLGFRLKEHFGDAEVFKDDCDLQGGERWPERLREELLRHRVSLVLIGHQWLFAQDRNGQRRLDDPEDWVRNEICTAFELGKCVLVLLVDGAAMPGIKDLPDCPLRMLPELQTMPMRLGSDFESDLARLISRLDQLLEDGSARPRAQKRTVLADEHTSILCSNLPVSSNSFIGRDREMRDLVGLLSADAQATFITLCGPPGTGKTRLATEVGRELLTNYPGGCWFADLVEARTAADVAQAVAQAFGVPLTGKVPPVEGVANFLEYREPLLLILDNFEQVVEHSPATIGEWRRKAPHISFLVTSRSLLGLGDEREFHLDPLPTPSGELADKKAIDVVAYESVRLFVDRAGQVRPGFSLDERNAQAVGEICTRLDGIPLAIELAAARVRVLQPFQILERLSQRFDLLRSSRRDLHQRHQTLMGAIEWSFDLLEPWEKEAFLQISIFRGGFLLDAAEAVLDLSGFPRAPMVVDVIQGLCEKELLKAEDSAYGTRFRMLVSIREFGEARGLEDCDAAKQQSLWKRFSEFHATHGETWNARIHSPACLEALDRLQSEIDNCFAAFSWGLQTGNFDLAARIILAMSEVLARRGPVRERIPRLDMCMKALGPDNLQLGLKLTLSLVDAMDNVGEWERSLQVATEAVKDAEALDAGALIARLQIVQSRLFSRRGSYPQAIDAFRRAKCILLQDPADFWLSLCSSQLGRAYMLIREDQLARESYTEAETVANAIGDPISLADTMNERGVFHNERGQLHEALSCFMIAEKTYVGLGDRRSSASTLSNQGEVLRKQGRLVEAIQFFNAAERINREFGNRYWLAANMHNRAMCHRGLGQLREAIIGYQMAEVVNRELGNLPWLAKNFINRGLILVDLEEFEPAIQCFSAAEEISAIIEDTTFRRYSLNNRGRVLARLGEYSLALECIAAAEQINRAIGDGEELAENLGNRGRALSDLEKLTEASESLRESLSLYEELQLRSLYRFEFTAVLASVESALGNQTESRRLAAEAMQLAEDSKLSDEHPAKWFTRLLPCVRKLLANREPSPTDVAASIGEPDVVHDTSTGH